MSIGLAENLLHQDVRDQTPVAGVAAEPSVQALLAPLQDIPVKPCAGMSVNVRTCTRTYVIRHQSLVVL